MEVFNEMAVDRFFSVALLQNTLFMTCINYYCIYIHFKNLCFILRVVFKGDFNTYFLV